MQKVVLGKTGLVVGKNSFGALPVQRIARAEAVKLMQKAFYGGMNYFDTARWYSDSEEKLGLAFEGMRDKIVISTKTGATTAEGFWADLAESLRNLRTDYIDIYQFHNPSFCPKPGDESGLYEAMLEAKRQGKVRFIGITNHSLELAREAVQSGLYDTLQFPLSYLSSEDDVALAEESTRANMGFIAMKALAGGLITKSALAYAYLAQFSHVAPIWGIQRESELMEFLSYNDAPPALDARALLEIEADRKELSGSFCRGCGYCMPCPVGIKINNCARMSLMIRRAPEASWLTAEWRENMAQIENCLNCGQCVSRCPYKLDTPALLRANYEDYKTFLG
ncbi:MAG: aldo/keto reductase [Clostridiaceae bacterium]|nr:aldo/keto reductase [Eubacteriales bacterium]